MNEKQSLPEKALTDDLTHEEREALDEMAGFLIDSGVADACKGDVERRMLWEAKLAFMSGSNLAFHGTIEGFCNEVERYAATILSRHLEGK